MTEPVWIHWSQGLWLVTRDGMELIEKTKRIILSDVRFVIDPVGLEISRMRRIRKTHAWAVGRLTLWEAGPPQRFLWLEWWPLVYRPRHGDDHFAMPRAMPRGDEGWELDPLAGADYLDADLDRDGWSSIARVAGPRYGETERRQVQHYGGRS